MKPFTLLGAFIGAFATTVSSAWACPYCESDVGREVAAGIFNDQFALNSVLTLLPIAILSIIVWFIHFGTPRIMGVLHLGASRKGKSGMTLKRLQRGQHG
jgi:hypothetical protein